MRYATDTKSLSVLQFYLEPVAYRTGTFIDRPAIVEEEKLGRLIINVADYIYILDPGYRRGEIDKD